MEIQSNSIESLFESVEAYGKTTLELAKLKALESASHVATSLVSRLMMGLVIILFVFVLNIGIALLIGDYLGKTYYGFFIVAAFYLIVGLITHFMLNNWIKKAVSNSIINSIMIND